MSSSKKIVLPTIKESVIKKKKRAAALVETGQFNPEKLKKCFKSGPVEKSN